MKKTYIIGGILVCMFSVKSFAQSAATGQSVSSSRDVVVQPSAEITAPDSSASNISGQKEGQLPDAAPAQSGTSDTGQSAPAVRKPE